MNKGLAVKLRIGDSIQVGGATIRILSGSDKNVRLLISAPNEMQAVRNPEGKPSIDRIFQVVEDIAGVKVGDMHTRKPSANIARYLLAHALREFRSMSYPEIVETVAGRVSLQGCSHSSAIGWCERARKLIDSDKMFLTLARRVAVESYRTPEKMAPTVDVSA